MRNAHRRSWVGTLEIGMITRELLGLVAAVTFSSLIACENDSPVITPPDRVFTSLEMAPSTLTLASITDLKIGNISLRAMDQEDVEMDVGEPSFSSSDPGVATVSAAGWAGTAAAGHHVFSAEVTAISAGEAVITASWTIGGITKTAKSIVTVESMEGWSLQTNPQSVTLPPGAVTIVGSSIVDAGGRTRIGPLALDLTSNRPDIAAVVYNENCAMAPCFYNAVRAVAPGTAIITASYGGVSGTATVTVLPPAPLQIRGGMSAEYQSIRVFRQGAAVTNANVTVNGVTIPHYSGELYSGHLPESLAAGAAVHLKVTVGDETVEGSGIVDVPVILEPANGSTFADTDSIRLVWSSADNPDQFQVCLNCWENSLWAEIYTLEGTDREFAIPPGSLADFGEGTKLNVTLFKDDFIAFAVPVASGSSITFYAKSADAVFRIKH